MATLMCYLTTTLSPEVNGSSSCRVVVLKLRDTMNGLCHFCMEQDLDFFLIYIYKAEKLSVCPSKIRWRPTIFLRPEGRLEAIFAPSEALIIQE